MPGCTHTHTHHTCLYTNRLPDRAARAPTGVTPHPDSVTRGPTGVARAHPSHGRTGANASPRQSRTSANRRCPQAVC
eukprot:13804822-Alexandrium_andersonii.AAC.1